MDFYNQLLAQELSGGGGGGDSNAAFKARVDGSLTEVTAEMLQGITRICSYAFYEYDHLTSIEIPNSVTSIGSRAFHYCRNLESVTVKAITPPALSVNSVFSGTPSSLVIYVPAESVDAYKAATNWSTYADKIQAIPSE